MSRDRKLTHEERMLWGKVTSSMRPLRGRRDPDEWVELGTPSAPGTDTGSGAARSDRGHLPVPVLSRPKPQASLPNPIEQPVRHKIARGRLALEGRIDLHGLMQAEAHHLLRTFLVRAHERGLRHVLVITGKGSTRGSEGILRRAVPQWLATPDLRTLVSGYGTASRGHGGEGALYVRLKRRRGDEP